MLLFKNSYWPILALTLIVTSCTPNETDSEVFADYQPKTDQIQNVTFIGQVEDAPVHFADLWNRKTINKLGITEISVFSFGGTSPEDTLEKKVYSFSNEGRNLAYLDYKFDETPAVWSKGTAVWSNNGKSLKLAFNKHFGIDRKLETTFQQTKEGYLILRKKSLGRYDSTWVKGTLENPNMVLSKIGNSVFSIDVYLPEGASTSDIRKQFDALGLTPNDLLLAEKNVIFTSNGKPISAYLLNELYSQVSQTKSWTYDENDNLSIYKEMSGNTIVRSISWKYREDLLPESMTIDRKEYFYHYR